MTSSRIRGVVFHFIPTFIVLGVFLLGFLGEPEKNVWLNRSTLWGPEDPFFSETAAQTKFIANPLLIWRGRPNYRGTDNYEFAGCTNSFEHNSYGLRDDEITQQKPTGTIHILNLGDSATWGLNLRNRSETYSDQLERILNHPSGKKMTSNGDERSRYEVINAGTVGYSSLQGVQFLHYLMLELQPDVVTIYLGNNDMFPSGTKDADRISATAGPIQNLLSNNLFYLILRRGFLALGQSRFAKDRMLFIDSVRNRSGSEAFRNKENYYRLLARVSPDQYEQNLRNMVQLTRQAGIKVILLKVPMNLVWPLKVRPKLNTAIKLRNYWSAVIIEPDYLVRAWAGEPPGQKPLEGHPYLCLITEKDFFSLINQTRNKLRIQAGQVQKLLRDDMEDMSLPKQERLMAMHNLGVWHLIHGQVDEAARLLESAVATSRKRIDCTIPYNISKIHYMLGITELIQGRKEEAFDMFYEARNIWPYAMNPDYEEHFDQVVRELDVEWIDLPLIFAKADTTFRGSMLMHDWVHPNAEGNRLIAETISQCIRPE